MGALVVGAVAGGIFVVMFTLTQNKWRIDDVLGVWPLHGLCGTWGGIAAGVFGTQALGGIGGINLTAQLAGFDWRLCGLRGTQNDHGLAHEPRRRVRRRRPHHSQNHSVPRP
jgi:ammonia channel protein AmtB